METDRIEQFTKLLCKSIRIAHSPDICILLRLNVPVNVEIHGSFTSTPICMNTSLFHLPVHISACVRRALFVCWANGLVFETGFCQIHLCPRKHMSQSECRKALTLCHLHREKFSTFQRCHKGRGIMFRRLTREPQSPMRSKNLAPEQKEAVRNAKRMRHDAQHKQHE